MTVGEQTTNEMLFGFFGATSAESPWVRIRTSAFPPPGLTDVPAPTKGKLTPELERYLGNWNSASVLKARGGNETKTSGHDEVEKTYGDTFLLVKTHSGANGGDTFELATFDPDKKMYRLWTYTSQGAVIEWTGQWDDAAKTLTWSAPITGDLNGTLKWNFANPEKLEVELQIRLGPFSAFTSNTTLTPKK